MLRKVKALAAEYDMLPRGARVLCAVSGGTDSMCLLQLLGELAAEGGFQICAAHYDHRLRGAESAGDAAFVTDWCAQLGIPCVTGGGDVAAEAARLGRGIEETAREMRYAFLRGAAEELGCGRIATAHNADDNAETLLLHLARGTGLHGLTGIPPRRGDIVRPLLTCSRGEIEVYLDAHGVPHREDSSNSDESYSRNRLRARVIPVLRELNPRFIEQTADTIRHLRADDDYLSAQADRICAGARREGETLVLKADVLAALPDALAIRAARKLLAWLGEGSCTAAHLRAIVELARRDDPSASLCLPGGRQVRRVYGELWFTHRTQEAALTAVALNTDGTTAPPGSLWMVRCTPCVCPTAESTPEHFYLARARCGGLTLRPRRTGDTLRLPHRTGSRTVKKYLIDTRIPRWDRERVPVLADEYGVAAVAGLGPDAGRLARPGEAALEVIFIEKKEV